MSDDKKTELVNVTIDGKQIQVPKGMNLIEAARLAGVEIPHYCYHPHLSIAGNCRMCQVEINGSPKLGIACNTTATEGLSVRTHFSCKEVEDAQKATLEFLLINHPLDCTVCDQAGHCKLQDYHYEYNSQASRFIEDKVHKVKAEVLGPEVVYDGERCIMCTRCVRFCDEVTETSELGAYNRGDKGYIGVAEGTELNNPLSGTVVDLCPVGALTHREWRFNTRIWYTKPQDSICPGCSTGCNVKVAERDNKIVNVKARLNSEVNKEWLCDEGRYGFDRFQPANRQTSAVIKKSSTFEEITLDKAISEAAKLKGSNQDAAVFISPFLTLEEVWTTLDFAEKVMGLNISSAKIAMQLTERKLSDLEKKLVSPDYAPNARAITLFDTALNTNDWRMQLAKRYQSLLEQVRGGFAKRVLIIGQNAILNSDLDAKLKSALEAAESVAVIPEAIAPEVVSSYCKVVIPGLTVHEKSGMFVNKDLRMQKVKQILNAPLGVTDYWKILNRIAKSAGVNLLSSPATDERGLFLEMAKHFSKVKDVTLFKVGELGVSL